MLSLFTSDTLLEMGIAHPLHQRRILREVQCFMKSCDGAADSLPAPGLRPSKIRAKPRQLVYEKDMRWPFLDIACVKLPTAEKTSSMTSQYGHWQRRMELEAKTRHVPKQLLCIAMFFKERYFVFFFGSCLFPGCWLLAFWFLGFLASAFYGFWFVGFLAVWLFGCGFAPPPPPQPQPLPQLHPQPQPQQHSATTPTTTTTISNNNHNSSSSSSSNNDENKNKVNYNHKTES